jgi:hypothetical protein
MVQPVIVNPAGNTQHIKKIVIVNPAGNTQELLRGMIPNPAGNTQQWWPAIAIEYDPWVAWGAPITLQANNETIQPTCSLSINADGTVTSVAETVNQAPTDWANLNVTSGADYVVRVTGPAATLTGGSLAGSLNTWVKLTTDQDMIITPPAQDGGESLFAGTINIARNDPDDDGKPLNGTKVIYDLIMSAIWGIPV